MDPVTHLISGALGAGAARRWLPDQKWLVPFCLVAACLPDADILIPADGPEASLLIHRGVSTSFFGMIFMAMTLAMVFRLIRRETPYLKIAALAYGLMCLHLWLDLITSYGTQIFAPFSNHRYALDGAFIIDPLLTVVAGGLAAWAFLSTKRMALAAALGIGWLFLYPMTNMLIAHQLERSYADRLTGQSISFKAVHVTPDGLDPLFWKVVVDTGSQYILDGIDILDAEYPFFTQKFRKADPELLARLAECDTMFATYPWFARWIHQEQISTERGTDVFFGDLRFNSANPLLRRVYNGTTAPFTLTAHLDPEGKLVSWDFNQSGSSFNKILQDR